MTKDSKKLKPKSKSRNENTNVIMDKVVTSAKRKISKSKLSLESVKPKKIRSEKINVPSPLRIASTGQSIQYDITGKNEEISSEGNETFNDNELTTEVGQIENEVSDVLLRFILVFAFRNSSCSSSLYVNYR